MKLNQISQGGLAENKINERRRSNSCILDSEWQWTVFQRHSVRDKEGRQVKGFHQEDTFLCIQTMFLLTTTPKFNHLASFSCKCSLDKRRKLNFAASTSSVCPKPLLILCDEQIYMLQAGQEFILDGEGAIVCSKKGRIRLHQE